MSKVRDISGRGLRVAAQAYNPSALEAEVQSQPGLHKNK